MHLLSVQYHLYHLYTLKVFDAHGSDVVPAAWVITSSQMETDVGSWLQSLEEAHPEAQAGLGALLLFGG